MRQQVSAINKNKGCKLISKKQVEEMEINTYGSTTSYQPQTTIFVNDVTTEYTEVLVEKNPQQTSSYSYGEERISNGELYYQTSRNRTVSSTTNNTGTIKETMSYTDYGLDNNSGYGYNGERRDAAGLIYLRNRTYDSSTGRFLQLDTYLGEKDSIITQNRSIAFNNNPYKYIDKGGNMAISLGSGGSYKPPTKKPSTDNACLVTTDPSKANDKNTLYIGGKSTSAAPPQSTSKPWDPLSGINSQNNKDRLSNKVCNEALSIMKEKDKGYTNIIPESRFAAYIELNTEGFCGSYASAFMISYYQDYLGLSIPKEIREKNGASQKMVNEIAKYTETWVPDPRDNGKDIKSFGSLVPGVANGITKFADANKIKIVVNLLSSLGSGKYGNHYVTVYDYRTDKNGKTFYKANLNWGPLYTNTEIEASWSAGVIWL